MSDPQATPPAAPLACRCRFPKRRRIVSGEDFSRLITRGSFATDETLIVNALPARPVPPRELGQTCTSLTASRDADSSPGGQRAMAHAAADPPAGRAAEQDAPGAPAGRLGVSIPRKAGNAVVRNRWKRLIREAYRLQQHELPTGFDFVVRPRRGAVADFARVRRSLRRLAARAASLSPESSGSRKHG